MKDLDEKLDLILQKYYAPVKLPDDNREDLIQAIKQLMVDEFEKLIGELEYRETKDMTLSSWTTNDIKAFGRNELKIELRQKLKEWKDG